LSKSFETYTQKQLEDTNGVIRSHNSKNRQYNGPKKNIKGRTSLISNFATFSVLELCPLIYLIGFNVHYFVDRFCPCVPLLLAIVLSLLIRFSDFEFPFWYLQNILKLLRVLVISDFKSNEM
jgi:hypothetical protein